MNGFDWIPRMKENEMKKKEPEKNEQAKISVILIYVIPMSLIIAIALIFGDL